MLLINKIFYQIKKKMYKPSKSCLNPLFVSTIIIQPVLRTISQFIIRSYVKRPKEKIKLYQPLLYFSFSFLTNFITLKPSKVLLISLVLIVMCAHMFYEKGFLVFIAYSLATTIFYRTLSCLLTKYSYQMALYNSKSKDPSSVNKESKQNLFNLKFFERSGVILIYLTDAASDFLGKTFKVERIKITSFVNYIYGFSFISLILLSNFKYSDDLSKEYKEKDHQKENKSKLKRDLIIFIVLTYIYSLFMCFHQNSMPIRTGDKLYLFNSVKIAGNIFDIAWIFNFKTFKIFSTPKMIVCAFFTQFIVSVFYATDFSIKESEYTFLLNTFFECLNRFSSSCYHIFLNNTILEHFSCGGYSMNYMYRAAYFFQGLNKISVFLLSTFNIFILEKYYNITDIPRIIKYNYLMYSTIILIFLPYTFIAYKNFSIKTNK